MFSELSVQEEADQEYERQVRKSAKRMALTHVMDVLAAAESMLRMVRRDMDPQHDGKVSGPSAILQAQRIVRDVLATVPDAIEVRVIDCVTECDEKGKLLWKDERVCDEVSEYVKDVLFMLSMQRVRHENNGKVS